MLRLNLGASGALAGNCCAEVVQSSSRFRRGQAEEGVRRGHFLLAEPLPADVLLCFPARREPAACPARSTPPFPMRIHPATVLLALFCAGHPADAQRAEAVPRRPALPATADVNDSRAYYDLGVSLLARRAEEAAAAFYWAAELEPRSAEALYARHAALLVSDPRRILDYHGFTRRAQDPAALLRVDSLYLRALMLDPFVQRRFERDVLRALAASLLSGGDPRRVEDATLLHHFTATMLNRLPPLLRARVHAAEGRLVESMRDYDTALREARRSDVRRESRRWIHHERARVYALAGNEPAALTELAAAVEAVEADERDVLVRIYTSKALLEHSRGMLHERTGDVEAAREAYSRALVEDLSYHPAHARLAGVALALGDTAAALDEMALAAATGARDPVARFAHGNLLAGRRRWEEAEAELTAAAELAPHFSKALLMQGFPLSDGSMVMLTIGHLRTPCGRVVQRQYRDLRAADYYRMARAERDTAGRPSCRTAGGRTVYGGGGIYPDVLLPEPEPEPVWLARLAEDGVHTRWIGGYLTDHAGTFTTPDALAAAPHLPPGALAGFRAFAAGAGHVIPEGAEADARLERMLVPEIAGTRWGAAGFYRVLVALDGQVAAAVREFGRAGEILGR